MDTDEKLFQLTYELKELAKKQDALLEKQEVITTEITSIRAELLRYKGFIGGVLFIITAIGTIVEIFGKKLGIY